MKVMDEADLQKKVKNIPIACIGPVTLQTLEEYGFHVKICPRVYTVNEMVKEIIKYVAHSHRIH